MPKGNEASFFKGKCIDTKLWIIYNYWMTFEWLSMEVIAHRIEVVFGFCSRIVISFAFYIDHSVFKIVAFPKYRRRILQWRISYLIESTHEINDKGFYMTYCLFIYSSFCWYTAKSVTVYLLGLLNWIDRL